MQSFAGKHSYIVENEEDIASCKKSYQASQKKKIYIVSQTTFNSNKFDQLAHLIKQSFPGEIVIDKTICDVTSNRQEETREISKQVDCMIIVGGKKSSNTKELEVISRNNCRKVYLVQTVEDLKQIKIDKKDVIGIMAGASTPETTIEEIINYLEEL